ncbi:MAG: hypothetical protein K2J26_01740 [Ruminococcus sp.]|nr:hypothetical protein [Ruminococcus sp.]
MNKAADTIKSIIFVLLILSFGAAGAVKLMKLQIVEGEDAVASTRYDSGATTFQREILPTRGEIIDYRGNKIIKNTGRTDIVLKYAFFPQEFQEGNEILIQCYRELADKKHSFDDILPVTMEKPYSYTDDDTESVTELLGLNVYATAENCIDKLISDYEISDDYTDEEKRIIAGMRYAMLAKDFSYSADFVLAKNVNTATVIRMKGLSTVLRGIEAVESADRSIVRGDILPHEIGVVGPIYAEEYDELKEKGYNMDDIVGKSGIEKAMESELRGESGIEEVTILNDAIVDIRTISDTVPGETVKLTIDGAFQLKLQGVLDNFLQNFGWYGGHKVEKGALVVLDAKTGAVRGMATAPTYNLKDFEENYDKLLEEPNSPMFNRCTWGQYLPGSTFKTVTATAGLNEGVIKGNTSYNCTRYYDFYGGSFQCTGYHSYISVRNAICVSCNIFFYETARNLGIDNITKYAKLYGLGSPLGLETGDAGGFLCNPETFAERGQPWYIGYVIQAGIGNQDCGFTPLQLATVANTIANKGVRYKPYLVDSLYTYGTNKQIEKTKKTIAETIDLNYDYVYDYIISGMKDAALNVPAPYSLTNLGFSVAIKTGTPQTDANDLSKQNSVFIGFAPADKPEIAFAGVIEGGEYSKYMVRDIILAYQECFGINGSKAEKQELPPEVRNGTTAKTKPTTTTTTTTTDSNTKDTKNTKNKNTETTDTKTTAVQTTSGGTTNAG